MSSTNTEYLNDLCQTCSQKRVEFRPSPLGGLGGFAVAPISKDDVIFAIPRDLILSSSAPGVLCDHRIAKLAADSRITAESLLCAFMVWNRSSNDNAYLASLPADYIHLIPSDLEGTNVGAQLQADTQELASQQKIIQEILPDVSLTLEEFGSARALYNSRRYPLRFAPTAANDAVGVEGTNKNGKADNEFKTDKTGNEDKKRKLQQLQQFTRVEYDPTQGSLCPLLDVLNHQSGRDHLRFDVTPTTLNVIANYDIKKGQEIYSNYDCDNNDQCLLQFGFVMTPSNHTTTSKSEEDNNLGCQNYDKDLDVFDVRVGPQSFHLRENEAIPESLLGDGGYGLEQHLESKRTAQANATPSNNPQVRQYMKSQSRILTALLEKVRQCIQDLEEEDDECGVEIETPY